MLYISTEQRLIYRNYQNIKQFNFVLKEAIAISDMGINKIYFFMPKKTYSLCIALSAQALNSRWYGSHHCKTTLTPNMFKTCKYGIHISCLATANSMPAKIMDFDQ